MSDAQGFGRVGGEGNLPGVPLQQAFGGGMGGLGGAGFRPGGQALCGGVTDRSDPSAPKTIAAEVIVSLDTYFCAYDPILQQNGFYHFAMTQNDDATYILDGGQSAGSVVALAQVAQEVRALIDAHHLAALNGTDRVTAGLPPEYQPQSFRAVFDTGEVLYFRNNGNPQCVWGLALKRLFAKAFAAAGNRAFEPPAEARTITKFSVEFNEGAVQHIYCTMECPVGTGEGEHFETRLCHTQFDFAKNESLGMKDADLTLEVLAGLQQVIEDCGMEELGGTPISFSLPFDAAGTLDIFVDYESGRQVYGQYRGAAVPVGWEAQRAALVAYFDGIFGEEAPAEEPEEARVYMFLEVLPAGLTYKPLSREIHPGDIILDKGFSLELLSAAMDFTKPVTVQQLTNAPLKPSPRLLRIKELRRNNALVAELHQTVDYTSDTAITITETEVPEEVPYGQLAFVRSKEVVYDALTQPHHAYTIHLAGQVPTFSDDEIRAARNGKRWSGGKSDNDTIPVAPGGFGVGIGQSRKPAVQAPEELITITCAACGWTSEPMVGSRKFCPDCGSHL